jgi:hypothetical protein
MVMVFDNDFDERAEKQYDSGPTSDGYIEIGGKVYHLDDKPEPSKASPAASFPKFNGNKIESIEIGGKVYDL